MEEVARIALELDEAGRAELAARLLDSLEVPGSDVAWEAELERRAEELESGAVKGISWEELQARLRRGSRER
ncbi:MAG TPA: addiction module protein [Thermoanaerobaculia bacterium]|nr:addiction module protein [Thermoanaerobaculia bacterium]